MHKKAEAHQPHNKDNGADLADFFERVFFHRILGGAGQTTALHQRGGINKKVARRGRFAPGRGCVCTAHGIDFQGSLIAQRAFLRRSHGAKAAQHQRFACIHRNILRQGQQHFYAVFQTQGRALPAFFSTGQAQGRACGIIQRNNNGLSGGLRRCAKHLRSHAQSPKFFAFHRKIHANALPKLNRQAVASRASAFLQE